MSKEMIFCVEGSNDPNTEEAAVIEYYHNFDAAAGCADRLKQQFRCVWFCELGEYTTRTGSDRRCWVYFWWTDQTNLGSLPQRGWGYPEDRETLVPYRPSAPERRWLNDLNR